MNLSRYCWPLIAISYIACSQPQKAAPVQTTPDYQKGTAFLNHNDDSAFYYFNKAATGSKNSYQIAIAYNNMALIQADKGDYFGSQETLLTALKYLDERKERDQYCLVAVYNQLGRNSSDLKNDAAAIGYYDTALKFSQSPDYRTIIQNNKAVSFQRVGQYVKAIDTYETTLRQSKSDKKEYARLLSNLAKVRWLQNHDYPAAAELHNALQIRRDIKDDWGLNASYAHLSDYYAHSRPDSALLFAGDMYTTAQKLQSPDDELEALQKLIDICPPKDVKKYFSRYQHLSDSLQTARNAAKNQFALIRYGAQKNKADVLSLQKDNTEERIQLLRQRTILIGTIALFTLLTGSGMVWYRRRRQALEAESRNAIRENQLSTSKKVHDVVANGLYRVMTQIEHQDNVGKDQLLDEIELLYEQSRDISYEQPNTDPVEFHERITRLLFSFSCPTTKVVVAGNHPQLWDTFNQQVKSELEAILQELMVNMKKHSSAHNVIIRFKREGDCVAIHYADDGVGLPPAFRYGNGLTNTENRISGMAGKIIFDKGTRKGLEIHLYLPTLSSQL